jgi:5-formyltetrahydrofolate cyclo-ligase
MIDAISRAPEEQLRRKVKDEIRYRMRQVRKAIPAASRAERSARIHNALFARPEWNQARTVLLFASMRTEVDTAPIERRARSEGKIVAAPRMNEEMTDLDPRVWDDGVAPYEQGRLAPEPPPDATRIDLTTIDLVVVPALALSPEGARIGYGKGFYDRLLATIPRARRIAVAFDFQLIAEVPETTGDERVHVIVTDQRVIDC